MSYLAMLLIFLVPPTVLLSVSVMLRTGQGTDLRRTLRIGLSVLTVLVLVSTFYTAPWDKWMIDRGVFFYPPAKVAAWIGGVPVEDLLLFAVQCMFVGSWSLLLVGRLPSGPMPAVLRGRRVRMVVTAAVIAAVVIGLAARSQHALYLSSISAWFGPLLAIQYAGGADVLLAQWRMWLAAVVPATMWLWIVEAVAVQQRIWWIDPAQSVTWRPGGLPLEDLIIFMIGNVFVVQTTMFATDPVARERIRAWCEVAVSFLTHGRVAWTGQHGLVRTRRDPA
jgi:lycopene cyclase domain-containing protein